MIQWTPYIIKSTSILLVLLVYYKLFLRKQTFFRLNRFYLLFSLVIAVITPFIYIEIHASALTPEAVHPAKTYMSNFLEEVYVLSNYPTEELPVESGSFNFLLWGYGLGVLGCTFRYLWNLRQLVGFKRRYPGKRFHGIHFYFLPQGQTTFSYFNNLFIDPKMPREDRRKIFEHEKIHIRECHSLDLSIAEIICITNWFNPLVWIFKNAIVENQEYIADRQVIRRYHTGSYLELLIRQTLKGAFSFTNYISSSNLKKRIIMMTKKQSRKYWVLSFIPVTAVLVTLLYGFTCNKTAALGDPIVFTTSPSDMAEAQHATDTLRGINDESDIVAQPEEMPRFTEGNVQRWVASHLKYPAEAQRYNIQGKVFVQFIIEKDGSVNNVHVIKGTDPLLDAEACRVIRSMPKWIPGKNKGQHVRVAYTFPINFALNSPKASTPDDQYAVYLQRIDQIEQKINNPALLTPMDKAPIGKGLLLGGTNDKVAYKQQLENMKNDKEAYKQQLENMKNDKAAYEQQLENMKKAVAPSMDNIKHLMDSLRFTEKEQQKVIKIYKSYVQNCTNFIKSIGPDHFIEKFAETPSFEFAKLMLSPQLELKKSLSPERYKQFVLGTYLKSTQGAQASDVFIRVEEMPEFQGNLMNWLHENIKYPASAQQKKTEGKVVVSFIIEKDGSVSEAKITKSVSPELDKEALRLINSMPKWKPGKQRGQFVRVSYTLPIEFKLK